MMRVGFTGSEKGMKDLQRDALMRWLHRLEATEFHHGDCIEADMWAHMMVLNIRPIRYIKIVIHPPDVGRKRAFCCLADEVRPEKPYLDRNKDIVNETAVLVASPFTYLERLRSGTWSTVRYARRLGRPVIPALAQRVPLDRT